MTKQAVHKKHARRFAQKVAEEGADDAERTRLVVTGRARQSVRFARREAEALGEPAVRTEHLLLGLLRDERGPVVEALTSAGVSLEAARREAARLRPRDGRAGERQAKRTSDAPLPIAPDARAVMEESLRVAVRRQDDHLGIEHLLLALLREPDGRAVRTLAALRVAPAHVEQLLTRALARAE